MTDELSNTNVHNIKETLASALLKKKQQEVEHQNQISSSSEAESDGDALDLDANVAPNDEDDLGEFDFDACLQEIVSHCSSQTRTEGAAAGRKGSKDKKQAQQQCQDSMVRAIGHEYDQFIDEKCAPREIDPIMWWQNNRAKYEHLAILANKYLSAPPSSVESERLFSIGGNIYSQQRSRLLPETGEKLMFLNFNLRVFNFKY